MTFPTITIPDPAAVKAMLVAEFPDSYLASASYDHRGWSMFAFLHGRKEDPTGHGATPEECLADLKEKMAACDPVVKLRKEWEAMGKPDLNVLAQPPAGDTPETSTPQ